MVRFYQHIRQHWPGPLNVNDLNIGRFWEGMPVSSPAFSSPFRITRAKIPSLGITQLPTSRKIEQLSPWHFLANLGDLQLNPLISETVERDGIHAAKSPFGGNVFGKLTKFDRSSPLQPKIYGYFQQPAKLTCRCHLPEWAITRHSDFLSVEWTQPVFLSFLFFSETLTDRIFDLHFLVIS